MSDTEWVNPCQGCNMRQERIRKLEAQLAALRASAVAEPVAKTDAEHFGDILKTEAARLRAMADRFDPAPAAPVPASVREAALEAAALEFIAKVDRGEARSKSSYAAFKAALASIPAPEAAPTEDVRWAVNYLLEQIAAKFESWDTFDLWRSDAASTVRSFKHDLSKPEAAPTREEIIEQCAKIARQYIIDMSDSRLDDRDISWIRAGADRASGEIADAILALKAAPAK